jgi:hypothetical protein
MQDELEADPGSSERRNASSRFPSTTPQAFTSPSYATRLTWLPTCPAIPQMGSPLTQITQLTAARRRFTLDIRFRASVPAADFECLRLDRPKLVEKWERGNIAIPCVANRSCQILRNGANPVINASRRFEHIAQAIRLLGFIGRHGRRWCW